MAEHRRRTQRRGYSTVKRPSSTEVFRVVPSEAFFGFWKAELRIGDGWVTVGHYERFCRAVLEARAATAQGAL